MPLGPCNRVRAQCLERMKTGVILWNDFRKGAVGWSRHRHPPGEHNVVRVLTNMDWANLIGAVEVERSDQVG